MKTALSRLLQPVLIACLLLTCGLIGIAQASSQEGQQPWSPAGCGHEPMPPSIDAGSVDHYNASIDRVGAYDAAARSYSACVTREALAEQTAISNRARARMDAINAVATSVQKRIAGNFNALSAQLRAAGKKLGGQQAGAKR